MDPRCSDSADALQIGPTLERLLNSSAYATVDAVSGQARPRKKPPPSASAGTGTWIHVVKRDETLSGIFDVAGWQRVAQLNNLRNPNLIYPGQQLRYLPPPNFGFRLRAGGPTSHIRTLKENTHGYFRSDHLCGRHRRPRRARLSAGVQEVHPR